MPVEHIQLTSLHIENHVAYLDGTYTLVYCGGEVHGESGLVEYTSDVSKRFTSFYSICILLPLLC